MNRREATIALFGLAATASPRAQQSSKIPRVGVLGVNLESAPRSVAAFRRSLQERGYVEGRNLEVVYRSAEGKPERLPALAAELVALPVDVIVATGGNPAADAARRATAAIPIVFIAIGDPVKAGFAESLARPGGNATGLSSVFPDTVAKLLQLVHETLPHATRVALLIDTNLPSVAVSVKNADAAARGMGMRIEEVGVRDAEDFERVFAQMKTSRTDALIVFGSPMILGQRNRLASVAMGHRIPLVAALREYTDAGGLMSYGPDLPSMFAAAAGYVDRILKGARPGDLPVEQPTKLELVVNKTTAAALGITIPKAVLARATE